VKPRSLGLVPQILIGVLLGALAGVLLPGLAERLGLLGQLFVAMLKAVAPLLVLVLVMSAIANRHESRLDGRKVVLTFALYAIGTVSAAVLALLMSEAFPQTIALRGVAEGSPPAAVSSVLQDVLFKLVDNPVNALQTGNFLGCLTWAVLLGLSFRKAPEGFRRNLQTLADGVSEIVRYVIRLAPVGIFGLVCLTVATAGLGAMAGYASLAALLVVAMLIMALVVNPLIVFAVTRENP
jgi:serine/threonine transporter